MQKKLDRIYNRQRVYVEGKHQEVLAENRQTKKDDPHHKKVWKAINYLKKDCKPSYSKMRNAQGRLVPLKERVETIATCLQYQHWSNHCGQRPLPNDQIIGDIPHCDSSLFFFVRTTWSAWNVWIGETAGARPNNHGTLKVAGREDRQRQLHILNDWWPYCKGCACI